MHNPRPVIRQLDKSSPSQDQGDIRREPFLSSPKLWPDPTTQPPFLRLRALRAVVPGLGNSGEIQKNNTPYTNWRNNWSQPSHSSQSHSRATLTLHPLPLQQMLPEWLCSSLEFLPPLPCSPSCLGRLYPSWVSWSNRHLLSGSCVFLRLSPGLSQHYPNPSRNPMPAEEAINMAISASWKFS